MGSNGSEIFYIKTYEKLKNLKKLLGGGRLKDLLFKYYRFSAEFSARVKQWGFFPRCYHTLSYSTFTIRDAIREADADRRRRRRTLNY